MPGFEQFLIPLITGIGSGLAGLGDSDKEEALKASLEKLYANEDYIKSAPFSKDEMFNTIFPMIKQLNMGASDVAAGRLGSAVGEGGANMGGGQNFVDYYVQALAPTIAQGQFASAEALQNLVQMYGQMDNQAKTRLLQLLGYEMQGAAQLPSMTDLQAFMTNFIQGGEMTSKIQGNLAMADYYSNKEFPNQGVKPSPVKPLPPGATGGETW